MDIQLIPGLSEWWMYRECGQSERDRRNPTMHGPPSHLWLGILHLCLQSHHPWERLQWKIESKTNDSVREEGSRRWTISRTKITKGSGKENMKRAKTRSRSHDQEYYMRKRLWYCSETMSKWKMVEDELRGKGEEENHNCLQHLIGSLMIFY